MNGATRKHSSAAFIYFIDGHVSGHYQIAKKEELVL